MLLLVFLVIKTGVVMNVGENKIKIIACENSALGKYCCIEQRQETIKNERDDLSKGIMHSITPH